MKKTLALLLLLSFVQPPRSMAQCEYDTDFKDDYGLTYFRINGTYYLTAHSKPPFLWIYHLECYDSLNGMYCNVHRMPLNCGISNLFVHEVQMGSSSEECSCYLSNQKSWYHYSDLPMWVGVDLEVKDAEARAFDNGLKVKLKATQVQGDYLKCVVVSTDVYDNQVISEFASLNSASNHYRYVYLVNHETEFTDFEATIYNADQFVRHEIQILNIFGEIVYSQEVKPENLNVKVYPTQVQSVLNISTALTAKAYSIVSQNGSPAASGAIAGNYQRLDVSNLTPGFYMICLYNDGTLLGTRKFIKTN
jgi:hypothetical protein